MRQDSHILRSLITTGTALCYATGNSMLPIYGDRSLLELTYVKDPLTLKEGTVVYFLGPYGFNRHLFGTYITVPTTGETLAVILNGDGSFDQVISPYDIIATVEVITNTAEENTSA